MRDLLLSSSSWLCAFFFLALAACGSGGGAQGGGGSGQAAAGGSTSGDPAKPKAEDKKSVVYFGDSLTEGYGLQGEEKAYPELIAEKLDSLGYDFRTVNAGLSGDTSTGGLERLDWVIEQRIDVFVLELGANDGLRGIEPEETRQNLEKIIERVTAKNPEVEILLAGIQVPPNMGPKFSERFRAIFPKVAGKYENVALLPFLLEGVAGERSLNQADGIHPTAEGHRIVADHVWGYLRPLIEKKA